MFFRLKVFFFFIYSNSWKSFGIKHLVFRDTKLKYNDIVHYFPRSFIKYHVLKTCHCDYVWWNTNNCSTLINLPLQLTKLEHYVKNDIVNRYVIQLDGRLHSAVSSIKSLWNNLQSRVVSERTSKKVNSTNNSYLGGMAWQSGNRLPTY